MSEKKKRLEESARLLRQRLTDLESNKPHETQRPMWEVAVQAVRECLSDVGRDLARMAA